MDRSGTRLNWCVERWIHSAETKKAFEEDGRWLWKMKEETFELDYLRVEKWFIKYCQISIDEKVQASENPQRFTHI